MKDYSSSEQVSEQKFPSSESEQVSEQRFPSSASEQSESESDTEQAPPTIIDQKVYRQFLSEYGLMKLRDQPRGKGALRTLQRIIQPYQASFEKWLELKKMI